MRGNSAKLRLTSFRILRRKTKKFGSIMILLAVVKLISFIKSEP